MRLTVRVAIIPRIVSCFDSFATCSDTMGISWVLAYPTPEGKSHNQALEEFGKLLISLGFEKDQPYTVECETYVSVPGLSLANNQPLNKSFHAILDSDRLASCFLVSEKDPANNNITAERSLLGFVVGKLSKAYVARSSSNIEVRGTSYLYRDFIVRAGIVTAAATSRAILVEVELRTCPVAICCIELMKEFVNSFMPVPVETAPRYLTERPALMQAVFTVMDGVLQYLEQFAIVRQSTNLVRK